jgi:hypothetical protein
LLHVSICCKFFGQALLKSFKEVQMTGCNTRMVRRMVHNLTSIVTPPVTSLLGSMGPVISIAMDLHLILIWLMGQDNFTV